jgi:hypothetical protein
MGRKIKRAGSSKIEDRPGPKLCPKPQEKAPGIPKGRKMCNFKQYS